MNEKLRAEYLRKEQEGMRAMTDAEISAKQRREVPGMMNSDQMRGADRMQNILASECKNITQKPANISFWQRVKQLFA